MATLSPELEKKICAQKSIWLVTGCAGFIGSHLTESLLKANQEVIGVDNFATGSRENLAAITSGISNEAKSRFRFVECDIRKADELAATLKGVRYVLHQAALGSVPRSIAEPKLFHEVNSGGFLNLCLAALEHKVERVVYASSSSVYGSDAHLPKRESQIGRQLSPYAATKRANEIFAAVYQELSGIPFIGLRYFNVFGPRQNPNSQYAAVIPKWIAALKKGEPIQINGDGKTSRDFTFVSNICDLNVLAAIAPRTPQSSPIYNGAAGQATSLETLAQTLISELRDVGALKTEPKINHADFRTGDIRHSLADLSLAKSELGYEALVDVKSGLKQTVCSFL